ncbi:MAG: hypothetical protein GWN01_15230 [Nitrosopumilaceae archaeon]|nr:hypothetical protein [Nitrosopumilaceae archaeon]NIU02196.1 hypothetical protein [Nitrosopumilaceae archaeon]NIU88668.1 hypothetical protein [Nitrosopumilaceae archaeon]NIV66818.1 hypothetical protein [Nitrosopumilaceae archaeon]NIX62797.1 hypothetical protein [Nitrosopumilaceae archaeon]
MAETAAEKWQNTIVKHRKKCQKILGVSRNIRYAGVINAFGRTLTGIVQPDVKPLLKSEQVKNEFFIISSIMTLRKDSEKAIGNLDYVLLVHQKVIIILLHKGKVTYYISVDKKTKNIEKVISSIRKIL